MKDFSFLFRRISDVITLDLVRELDQEASEKAIKSRHTGLTKEDARNNIPYIGQLLALETLEDRRICANQNRSHFYGLDKSNVLHHVFQMHGFEAGELSAFQDALFPVALTEDHLHKGYFYKSLEDSCSLLRDADPLQIAKERLQFVIKEKYGVDVEINNGLTTVFTVSHEDLIAAGLTPEAMEQHFRNQALEDALSKFTAAWLKASKHGDKAEMEKLVSLITPQEPL